MATNKMVGERVAREAALEWRERYRRAKMSAASVWNSAIYECMDAFGIEHNPKHSPSRCLVCYAHSKLRELLRPDGMQYEPSKERILGRINSLADECQLDGDALGGYATAIEDASKVIETTLDDDA